MTTAPGTDLRDRRLLVVSHDFPPVRSPQALRALEFVRGLAAQARQVDVVTRTAAPGGERPSLPANVSVHECSPGFFEAALDRVSRRRATTGGDAVPANPGSAPKRPTTAPMGLNWKGRLAKRLRRTLDYLLFPDGRALWLRDARARIHSLCATQRPDAALLMHEPAVSLLAGLTLNRHGVPWLADIADPVLAPYTPWHWRGRARRLEQRVLAEAAAVTVTNAATGELLQQRYPQRKLILHVLPQGFSAPAVMAAGSRDPMSPLTLCYTGRLYAFRDPTALLAAVRQNAGVRLLIAGPEMPDSVLRAAAEASEQIIALGELEHEAARRLQREADVLVSLGNAGTVQTPGKIYEYFGSCRPLLHISGGDEDPLGARVLALRRGLQCANASTDIALVLADLLARKRNGELDGGFDLSLESVAEYSWQRISQRLAELLAGIVRPA